MNKVTISTGDISLLGELNDSPTARSIWDALPIEGTAKTWGDEIYLTIPVTADQAPDARALVEVGELGYWSMGQALCLFFGPTPASTDDRPRAYSPVNIVGRILDDVAHLRGVKEGDRVRVTRRSVEG